MLLIRAAAAARLRPRAAAPRSCPLHSPGRCLWQLDSCCTRLRRRLRLRAVRAAGCARGPGAAAAAAGRRGRLRGRCRRARPRGRQRAAQVAGTQLLLQPSHHLCSVHQSGTLLLLARCPRLRAAELLLRRRLRSWCWCRLLLVSRRSLLLELYSAHCDCAAAIGCVAGRRRLLRRPSRRRRCRCCCCCCFVGRLARCTWRRQLLEAGLTARLGDGGRLHAFEHVDLRLHSGPGPR
jgi:hypothetical protein